MGLVLSGCPTPSTDVDAGGADTPSTVDGPGPVDARDPIDGGGAVFLTGAVEKGPFVTGSSVRVGVLDPATLAPVGTTFDTSTLSDLGDWELLLPTASPIQIEGDGYYYNEALGALSTSRIVLRALYVPTPTATQTAYVNLITHLTNDRVRTLVRAGTAFDDAVAQAEDELRTQLGITVASFEPARRGVALSLVGGDDDANAYLFAVSTVLAYAARARTSGSPDANLQELTNTLTLDLRDGTIEPARLAEIHAALPTFRTAEVEERFAARLSAIGSSASVPDLDRVLDQDRDGLVNASDNCPIEANPDQADGDGDGQGDACDACPSTACPNDCIPASPFGSPVDLCVERCGDDDPCRDSADVCIHITEMISVYGFLMGTRVCASPCHPTDLGSCNVDETCDAITLAESVSSPYASQWACLPATVGAGPGTRCSSSGALGIGCDHGLVCEGTLGAVGPHHIPFPTARAGICRAPCGGGTSPPCATGETCAPRRWDTTSYSHTLLSPADGTSVCSTPGASTIPEGGECMRPQEGCAPGLVCFYNRCTPARTVGESCSRDDRDCATPLVCRQSDAVCVPRSAAGGSCGRREECEAGLGCDNLTGTCVTALGAGEACDWSDACAAGLSCIAGRCSM